MIRKIGVYKPRWLPHVYLFIKYTMQERIVDIKLFDSPSIWISHCKNNSYSDRFDYRTKCLRVIKSFLLGETLGSFFKTLRQPINSFFNSKNPLVANDVLKRRWSSESLGVIAEQSVIFINHSHPLSSILTGLSKVSRSRYRWSDSESILGVWLANTMHGSCSDTSICDWRLKRGRRGRIIVLRGIGNKRRLGRGRESRRSSRGNRWSRWGFGNEWRLRRRKGFRNIC